MTKVEAKALGVRVKEYRVARLKTQFDAAKDFGISHTTYVRVELGQGCGDLTKRRIELILSAQAQQAVA